MTAQRSSFSTPAWEGQSHVFHDSSLVIPTEVLRKVTELEIALIEQKCINDDLQRQISLFNTNSSLNLAVKTDSPLTQGKESLCSHERTLSRELAQAQNALREAREQLKKMEQLYETSRLTAMSHLHEAQRQSQNSLRQFRDLQDEVVILRNALKASYECSIHHNVKQVKPSFSICREQIICLCNTFEVTDSSTESFQQREDTEQKDTPEERFPKKPCDYVNALPSIVCNEFQSCHKNSENTSLNESYPSPQKAKSFFTFGESVVDGHRGSLGNGNNLANNHTVELKNKRGTSQHRLSNLSKEIREFLSNVLDEEEFQDTKMLRNISGIENEVTLLQKSLGKFYKDRENLEEGSYFLSEERKNLKAELHCLDNEKNLKQQFRLLSEERKNLMEETRSLDEKKRELETLFRALNEEKEDILIQATELDRARKWVLSHPRQNCKILPCLIKTLTVRVELLNERREEDSELQKRLETSLAVQNALRQQLMTAQKLIASNGIRVSEKNTSLEPVEEHFLKPHNLHRSSKLKSPNTTSDFMGLASKEKTLQRCCKRDLSNISVLLPPGEANHKASEVLETSFRKCLKFEGDESSLIN